MIPVMITILKYHILWIRLLLVFICIRMLIVRYHVKTKHM